MKDEKTSYLGADNYDFKRKVEDLPLDAKLGSAPVPSSENRLVTEKDRRLVHVGSLESAEGQFVVIDNTSDPVSIWVAVGMQRATSGGIRRIMRDGKAMYYAPVMLGNTVVIKEGKKVMTQAGVDLIALLLQHHWRHEVGGEDEIAISDDHGELSGLADDDHSQYALLLGRSGGQHLNGGMGTGDDLTLESTSHATKGDLLLNPNGGPVGIAVTPESWADYNGILQIGDKGAIIVENGEGYEFSFNTNAYYDGDDWKRLIEDKVGAITVFDGEISIDLAGTDVADSAIAWVNALYIYNSTGISIGDGFGTDPGAGSLIIEGSVSIGMEAISRKLCVSDSANPQLRLDGFGGYVDFESAAGGDLVITPNGGDVDIIGRLGATVHVMSPIFKNDGDITINALDGAANTTIHIENSDGTYVADVDIDGALHVGTALNGALSVGVNASPNAWTLYDGIVRVGDKGALAVYDGLNNSVIVASNAYYDSGWKHIIDGYANIFYVGTTYGQSSFHVGASGNADTAIVLSRAMTIFDSGGISIGDGIGGVADDPDNGTLKIEVALRLLERSVDPSEPVEGETVMWMSDGTAKGDDGDVMIASKAGGVTNYGILFDHSGGAAW